MALRPSSSVEQLRALAFASIPSRSRCRPHHPRCHSSSKRSRHSPLPIDAEEGEILSDDDDDDDHAAALPNAAESQAKDTDSPNQANTNLAQVNRSSHPQVEGDTPPVLLSLASRPRLVLEEAGSPTSPVSIHNKKEKPTKTSNPSLAIIETTPSSANSRSTKAKCSTHPASTQSKEIDHRRCKIPLPGNMKKHSGSSGQKIEARQSLEDNGSPEIVLAPAALTGVPRLLESSKPTSGNSDVYTKSMAAEEPHASISAGSLLSYESADHWQKVCSNPYQFPPMLKNTETVNGKDAELEARSNGKGGFVSCTSNGHKRDTEGCVWSQHAYPSIVAHVNGEKLHGISEIQQWREEENLIEKELEEAQQHRHNCEVRELLVRRQYRDARGALQFANMRCETLYQRREMVSARILNARLNGMFSASVGDAEDNVVCITKQQEPPGSKNGCVTFDPASNMTKKSDEQQNQAFQAAPLT